VKWIIVLGMHRSGTSAITRAVGRLGASAGDEARMQKHWENVPLRHMNEELLAAGRGDWDAPPPRGWLTSKRVGARRTGAKHLLEQEFPEADVTIWKDPRTCLTLPFWLDLVEGAAFFLVIHRHPTEVAASLTARNKYGRGVGYALWERYNADALAAIAGRPAVVLDYGKVVSSPVEALDEVKSSFAALGLELPNDPRTTDHGLVVQERHHTAAAADAVDVVATPSQRELFDRLRALEGSHVAMPGPAAPPAQSPLSMELLDLVGKLRKARGARRRARVAANATEDGHEPSTEPQPEAVDRQPDDDDDDHDHDDDIAIDAAAGRAAPG